MSKYHSSKSGGFDSRKEQNRYKELLLMQRAGQITDLKTQVKFDLLPAQPRKGKSPERKVVYIADFTYYDKNGEYIVEDVKGYKGGEAYRLFVLKRKLMLWVHHIQIKET